MIRFNGSAPDGLFEIKYETIAQFKEDYPNVQISDRMVTNYGVVITPADQETKDEVEKHAILEHKQNLESRRMIDSGMNYSNADAQKYICEAIGLSEMELALLEHKSEVSSDFYVENNNGRFFISNTDRTMGLHRNELMSGNSQDSIGVGSIGRKDISCVDISGAALLILDRTSQAVSIADIADRPLVRNVTSSIRLDAYTGNEDTPGTGYTAFDFVASGDDEFIDALSNSFSYYDNIHELCGFSYGNRVAGFCNSVSRPIILEDDRFYVHDQLKCSETCVSMVPELSADYEGQSDAIDVIDVNDRTMTALGCKEDADGIYLGFESFVDDEFKVDSFILERGQVYSLESILASKPVTVTPEVTKVLEHSSFGDKLAVSVAAVSESTPAEQGVGRENISSPSAPRHR